MIISFELNDEQVYRLYFISQIKKKTLADILREAVAKYLDHPVYNTKSFNRQFLYEIQKLTTTNGGDNNETIQDQ